MHPTIPTPRPTPGDRANRLPSGAVDARLQPFCSWDGGRTGAGRAGLRSRSEEVEGPLPSSSDVVLAHCVWLSEAEEALLQQTDSGIAHCPSTNLKLASGVARIPELLARGIRMGIGADGAQCNNHLSAYTEMRLAALLQNRCVEVPIGAKTAKGCP